MNPAGPASAMNGADPQVSVIVPAYKAGATLRAAVDSLLGQSLREIEVIVVEDACPQACTAVLDGATDPRLRVLRLPRNGGVSTARNAGMAQARADLIALLDADDISLPDRLARQVALMRQRPELGLCAGLSHTIDEAGRRVQEARDTLRLSEPALAAVLLFLNPLTTSSFMVRRSALPAQGFRSMLSEDYDLVVEIAATHPITLIPQALVEYRLSSGGAMSTRLEQVAAGAVAVQRRQFQQLGIEAGYDAEIARSITYFGVMPSETLNLEWLRRVKQHLDRVDRANLTVRLHAPQALAEASTRVWEMMLLEAGRRGGLRLGGPVAGLLADRFPGHASPLRVRAAAHSMVNLWRRSA